MRLSLVLLVIVGWAFLKAYVLVDNAQKKFELAKSCQQKFKKIESKLDGILTQSNPIVQLEELRKNIELARDAAEDAWVYTAIEPEKYKDEINILLNRICAKYQTCWTDVPIEFEVERIEK